MVSFRRIMIGRKEDLAMGFATLQKNKLILLFAALLMTVIYFFFTEPQASRDYSELAGFRLNPGSLNKEEIEKWWAIRKNMKNLSKLGEVLFQDHPEPVVPDGDKKYQILIWKYGHTIENRHLKRFSGQWIDPFEYCPVKNCYITYNSSHLNTANIVIFHLHRIKGLDDLPKKRPPNQIWAFLTDESPYNTFMKSKDKLKDFNNVFNWSMSYRSDSDIPVPYGRTILKKSPGNDKDWVLILDKKRDILVAILGSNCGGQNHRWKYVEELQNEIQVDVYGGCGPIKNKCPGHFKSDCLAINDYLFYLSFENSNCNEYITEKLWWNAYQKYSIPIVMGSSLETYQKLLPVGSYINVDDFANPRDLARELLRLNETGEFMNYHRWRNNFNVLNEHGYFQSRSYHYCRICQALNYNTKDKKVYSDLENYWSVQRDCHDSWDDWRKQ